MKRYLVRLSTGEAGVATRVRTCGKFHHDPHKVFDVRVRRMPDVWPDYDVCEVPRMSWWLARWLGG